MTNGMKRKADGKRKKGEKRMEWRRISRVR